MKATAKDLRIHTKRLLDAVARGEEITITYRGKPCARLAPVTNSTATAALADDPAYGLWKDHEPTQDVEHYVDGLRRARF